ncbi:thiosulfate sulfurtransferase/rhodanese-like domain-containing protein 3 [Hylaeus volcanicus]|uniref:thiosulfate sulfurtransferase/rhodanese-like domain-containing protein 3 n=1 Tax=Hylaeus volcanicus TaxID=313075 RepID=UPI0023B82E5E|nr:thiosulfate sulfurtransferase/rhodanese-like domain-containing protein 3 [Hylaeus volcanicus]
MSSARELIMTYSKIRQFCRPFVSFRSFRYDSYIIQKNFLYDKLLKITSHTVFPVHDRSTLCFSTSTYFKSDSNTMCEGDTKELNVYYKDILKAQNDDDVLIIDVREQSEIDETGKLPGSIHIPMGDVSNALLNLSEKDFKERFNKEKPTKDTRVILSCRSGKRSGMILEEMQRLGYHNVYNYVGGWLDWESNQKV